MEKLGYAYVAIQALLSQFVVSASPPASFEIIESPLIGMGNVSNSSASDTIIFTNLTTQSIVINDTGNAGLHVRCNGQKFGTPLNLQSCLGAISTIKEYDKEDTFGMRGSEESDDITCPLPFRWLNPIADGFCKVQIFLISPATVAHASTTQIKEAALAIYGQCGAGRTPSKGGVAINIGGDNNLAVVLGATNNQNVICQAGTPPSRSACSDIIMHMFANPTRRRFGANLVAPDVRIPLIYKSFDNSCWGFITTNTGTDYSAWYNMWEAASALEGMCVRDGKNGIATGIGEAGTLLFGMKYHNTTETNYSTDESSDTNYSIDGSSDTNYSTDGSSETA